MPNVQRSLPDRPVPVSVFCDVKEHVSGRQNAPKKKTGKICQISRTQQNVKQDD